MKGQIKAPEKELNKMKISNLSDAELKTLVIRMLTELIELGRKTKEQMKATQSEIKQNSQGTNSDRKETGIQINGLDQKEEMNIQQNRMKKQEVKKLRRGLGTSGTTLNVLTSES